MRTSSTTFRLRLPLRKRQLEQNVESVGTVQGIPEKHAHLIPFC